MGKLQDLIKEVTGTGDQAAAAAGRVVDSGNTEGSGKAELYGTPGFASPSGRPAGKEAAEKEGNGKEGRMREWEERLLCAEGRSGAAQVKKFPACRNPADIFAICWKLEKEIARMTLLPSDTPSAFRISTAGIRKTERHSHDYLELAYVAEGELRQRIQGKNVSFSKGELLLIDRNCIHQDYVEGNEGSFLFLGIRDSVFQEALSQIRLRGRAEGYSTALAVFFQEALLRQKTKYQYLRFSPQPDREAEIEELLYGILSGLRADPIGGRYLCRGLVLWLIQILCETDALQLSREENVQYRRLLYEEVIFYLERNYKEVSISDLVERFRFQEDYFTRLLREYSGQTFKECLQEIRLNRAEELVRGTELKIDEIVASCGYRNKGYFYDLFRERFGMTPAQLRRKSGVESADRKEKGE